MTGITSRRLRLLALAAGLILGVALLAAACGGGNGDDGDAPNETPAGETPAAETPTDGATEPISFDVSMGDNFFEPKEFTVSPGQQVTFNIVNNGTAIHNMRVDGGDGQYNTDDDTVSDPALFNPGDAGTLVWTAPDEPGTIIFQCDFHPTDMFGEITVQ